MRLGVGTIVQPELAAPSPDDEVDVREVTAAATTHKAKSETTSLGRSTLDMSSPLSQHHLQEEGPPYMKGFTVQSARRPFESPPTSNLGGVIHPGVRLKSRF